MIKEILMFKKSVTYFGLPTFILFLLMIFLSTSLYAQLAETPWPMFRHDLQHTGRSPYVSVQKPILKWAFQTQGPVTSSPAIGEDGTIYFGSKDNKFYAITRDGKLKWAQKTADHIMSSPAIAPDGMIYFGSGDYYLFAMKPEGKAVWSFGTRYLLDASPLIAPNGNICIGSEDAKFYVFRPDGQVELP